MDGESLSYYVIKGDESQAREMAEACRKAFAGARLSVAALDSTRAAWRVLIRIPPPEDDESQGWRDVAELLASAMGSLDMTLCNPFEERMREKLDQVRAEGIKIMSARPETAIFVGIAEEEPVALDVADTAGIAWKLIA